MSRASLAGRIAAVEAARRARRLAVTGGGALSKAERAELDQLLAAERPDIDNMTGAEADEWLHRHSIDGDDGSGDKLDELRRRARTSGQVAEDLAHERRMAGPAERNAYLADRAPDSARMDKLRRCWDPLDVTSCSLSRDEAATGPANAGDQGKAAGK